MRAQVAGHYLVSGIAMKPGDTITYSFIFVTLDGSGVQCESDQYTFGVRALYGCVR